MTDGYTEDECTCNEPVALMDLMDKTFGKENCGRVFQSPHAIRGDFYECSMPSVGGGGIVSTATLSVKDYAVSAPDQLTLVYNDGAISMIQFANDCNDLVDAKELLDGINDNDDDGGVMCPAVYEPVICGNSPAEQIFSNQCHAGADGNFSNEECTCYETDELRLMLEDTFSSCDYDTENNLDNVLKYVCKSDDSSGPVASLYMDVHTTPAGDVIEIADTLFFAATGQSNTDMMFFDNDCKDKRNAVMFLSENGMQI